MRNFETLIVSVVKLCKQCLHSASALRPPEPLYRGFALGPHWGTYVPRHPGLQLSPMKISDAATECWATIYKKV